MTNNVFFSWQSDTPTDIGRNFLKSALEQACKKIANDTSIDESMRDLSVDSDTSDVAGQPPIVDTIFKKIDSSSVYVGDMSFIGENIEGDPIPNPNVSIEYGWALKSIGWERTILVMNTAFGAPSKTNMPFNLIHVKWPITYHLPKDATPEIKAEEKKKLISIFEKAIRSSMGTIPVPVVEPPPAFVGAIAKDGPARFRNKNEELGLYEGFGFRDQPSPVFLQEGPAIWLRIMPITPPGKTWTSLELKEIAQQNGNINIAPLMHGSGLDWLRAEDGWGIYTPTGDNKNDSTKKHTSSIIFMFETGEIWSVDTTWLDFGDNHLPFIETKFTDHFIDCIKLIQATGTPFPYRWEVGITGIKGRELYVPIRPGYARLPSARGPICLTDTIKIEGTLEAGQEVKKVLLPFYDKIFEKCGIKPPPHIRED